MTAVLLLLLACQDDPGRTVVQAVDRLTERLTVLKGRTQVIWLFDNSASMRDDRKAIADRVGKVFEAVPEKNRLSMAVVSFSNKVSKATDFLSDPEAVRKALLNQRGGGSGNEKPLTAAETVSTWFSGSGHSILVIVTDERGDDIQRLEEIIGVVRDARLYTFVIGPETPFQWPMRSERDRQNDTIIPTPAGLESADFEVLAFNPICCAQRGQPNYGQVYPGCRKLLIDRAIREYTDLHKNADPLKCDLLFEEIRSGYGPWGLSRLASRTGGEFIVAGLPGQPAYAPEYASKAAYDSAHRKDPGRKAVIEVVRAFHKKKHHGLIASTAVSVAGGQARAAEKLDRKCVDWISGLEEVTSESSRWQANRDLVLVQLRAMRHYLEQFALAFRGDLSGVGRSHYSLASGPVRGEGKLREEARAAIAALIKAHPNTPWAATAKRIGGQLGGFRLVGFDPEGRVILPPEPE